MLAHGSSPKTASILQDSPPAVDELRLQLSHLGVSAKPYETAEALLAAPDCGESGCVICDFFLPGMTGLELQRQLSRQAGPAVVFLSDRATVRLAVQAMEQGAVTVLPRPYDLEELRVALQEAGRRSAESEAQRELGLPHAREVRGRLRQLSSNERAVMDAIITGRSNKSIAQEQQLGLRTIEAHRQQIFRKLGVDSVAQLVASVLMVRLDPAQPIRAPHFLAAQPTHDGDANRR